MVVLLDALDEFTSNIAACVAATCCTVITVGLSDATTDRLLALRPGLVCMSPGPGSPCDSAHLCSLFASLHCVVSLMVVCICHQVVCSVLGGRVATGRCSVHGRPCSVFYDGACLLYGVPQNMAGRSNCLTVWSYPAHGMRVCAWSACCSVMAVRHAKRPTQCVQFHPESEFTQYRGAIFAKLVSQALVST
ncbi:Aminodeoxychorismate/anthranilate synthase component 2 [Candidatus Tremblaya princeps]|uniref:Aminodeoxychorismate/anthranilate synthase component 2 n=1 Tax=Tremblaya princeps TaxID=189385 RepID=A0A143WPF1_TREPR|nr:Aminodeoxychorismate/anthranilate synthase component 2 [Candidatus Tremblaya princeps]